jgi:probable H4MPT-linked C1 transfer pathway protein
LTLILGLDIGGANTKSCCLETGKGDIPKASGDSVYYEMWRQPEGLKDVLGRLRASRRPAGKNRPAGIALTMTAELCDVFLSKAQGVTAILEMVEEVFTGVPIYVWTTNGVFVRPSEIKNNPLQAAAANWLASAEALAVSPLLAGESALLADMGSTTTDLLPVASGKVLAKGRTDTERLWQGELLYTGTLRTDIQAILDEVYLDGSPCGVAREYFAVSADAYRFLGLITEAEYDVPTPDGKGKDPEACAKRLARVIAAEPEEVGEKAIYRIARAVQEQQTRQIMDSIVRIVSRKDLPEPRQLVTTGQGSFILKEAARRLGLKQTPWWRVIPGASGRPAMTGFAVAWLLDQQLRGRM